MKRTEAFKCAFSSKYAYKQGILAARLGDYENAADYLTRIPSDEQALNNFMNFIALTSASLFKRRFRLTFLFLLIFHPLLEEAC